MLASLARWLIYIRTGSDMPAPSFNPLSKKGKEITPQLNRALEVMEERKERMTNVMEQGKQPDLKDVRDGNFDDRTGNKGDATTSGGGSEAH
jgi:hypothetical protein